MHKAVLGRWLSDLEAAFLQYIERELAEPALEWWVGPNQLSEKVEMYVSIDM
jgi:hypothetical protein